MEEDKSNSKKAKRGRYLQYIDPSVKNPEDLIPRSSSYLWNSEKTSSSAQCSSAQSSSAQSSSAQCSSAQSSSAQSSSAQCSSAQSSSAQSSSAQSSSSVHQEVMHPDQLNAQENIPILSQDEVSSDAPSIMSSPTISSCNESQSQEILNRSSSESKTDENETDGSESLSASSCDESTDDNSFEIPRKRPNIHVEEQLGTNDNSSVTHQLELSSAEACGAEGGSLFLSQPDLHLSDEQQTPVVSMDFPNLVLPSPYVEGSVTTAGEVSITRAIRDSSSSNSEEERNEISVQAEYYQPTHDNEASLCSETQLMEERISLMSSDISSCSNSSDEGGSPVQSNQDQSTCQEDVLPNRENAAHVPILNRNPGFERLRSKLEGDFKQHISQNPVLTKGEIILNALRLSSKFNLAHVAEEALMKFVNSIFGTDVVPSSKYLLDKLFFSDDLLTYHFYCSSCQLYFGTSVNSTVSCRVCFTLNDVSNLNCASYFVTIDLPAQLELIFSKPEIGTQLRKPRDLIHPTADVLYDLYDGSMYRKFSSSLNNFDDGFNHISFTACADGSPLFSSSNCSIWPLLVMIHELPPLIRSKNLLLAGLWFGNHKPKMSMFLKPFVDNVNVLSYEGCYITVNESQWRVKAYLLSCCVDAGARGAVQGLHQYNGAFGCNWCLHPGETLDKTIKYPNVNPIPEKRTAAEVLQDGQTLYQSISRPNEDIHVNGVIDVSPLNSAPYFDIVNSMIVEYLHNAVLGVTRYFTNLWLGSHGTKEFSFYCGEPQNLKIIDKRLLQIKPPKEVRRCPRSILERKHWKGKEWEAWVLFYSLPVMKGILPDQYWKHWHFFVQALSILLSEVIPINLVNIAHALLTVFVTQVEFLYKKKDEEFSIHHMTYNVHILLHLSENVGRWGPLWSINGYCFEDENQTLKNMVHANKGIPHQVCRAFSKRKALELIDLKVSSEATEAFKSDLKSNTLKKILSIGNIKFMGKFSQFIPSEAEEWLCRDKGLNDLGDYVSCDRLVVRNVMYSCKSSKVKRTNNSIALLSDHSFVVIKKIIVNSLTEQCFLFVSKIYVSPYDPLRDVPAEYSSIFKIDSVSSSLILHNPDMLRTICIEVQLDSGHFVCMCPNIFNVC